MTRRRRGNPDRPTWLSLIEQPSVIRMLSALHHHGPHGFDRLCAWVSPGRRAVTTNAICKLAAFGLLRCHGHAGSFDHPNPGAVYELTGRGHRFARTWFDLDRFIAQHQMENRRRFG